MKRRLIARAGFLAGFGLAVLIGAPIAQQHIEDNQPAPGSAADIMEGRPSVVIPNEARMVSMIEAGTCWTGGEGHPVPGHVWHRTSRNGGAAYVLRGEAAVANSLEQIFDGTDHGLDIVAFCE